MGVKWVLKWVVEVTSGQVVNGDVSSGGKDTLLPLWGWDEIGVGTNHPVSLSCQLCEFALSNLIHPT